MYKNYEKRVKEFITEMTNPSSQIVITDITEKVNNCRQELMNESKMQKPFIFKGYITEQDRINDTVKNNKLLFNLPDYPDNRSSKSNSKEKEKEEPPKINFHIETESEKNKTINNTPIKIANPNVSLEIASSKEIKSPLKYTYKRRMSITEKNQIKSLIKKDSILQPQMRFTARTDLERVYDALKGDYIRQNEREIIERQLKHIHLFNYKKPKELLKGDRTESFNDEHLDPKMKDEKSPIKDKKKNKNIKNIYGPSNVYYEARNNDNKIWARKDNLNLEARGLLSSYHFKTHFKATEEIAQYKSNNKKNIKETIFLLPHLLPKKYRYKISNKNGNLINISNSLSRSVKNKKLFDYSKLEDTRKLFKFDEEHEKDEIIEKNNEGNYNGVNNPILKDNKMDIDPQSLKILSKLAFKPVINEEEDLNSIDNNDINLLNNGKDKDYDKNKVEEVSKINQVAKKILKDCNVYNEKSKFNNSSHKTKGGKTMITKGMTVEEFESKYNL